MNSTKKEILEYTQKLTKNFDNEDFDCFTAQSISNELNISRNLASQHLNDLHKEGVLIKIQSRPVYFLSKKEVESYCSSLIDTITFLSIEEFRSTVVAFEKTNSNFKKAIGNEESLFNCINQLKTAISYENFGLSVLLEGKAGTGKTLMANLLCEYALDNKLIPSEKYFSLYKCSHFLNDEINFNDVISKIEKFKLNNSNHVIFFDDIHLLSIKNQEILLSFLDKNNRQRDYSSNQLRFIFSTSQNLDYRIEQKIMSRIPLIIQIPSLDERSIDEKEALIYSFYKNEALNVGKQIYISNNLNSMLLQHSFKDNVRGLQNSIKVSIVNALLDKNNTNNHRIDIYAYHLPPNLIVANSYSENDNQMIAVSSHSPIKISKKIISYYDLFVEAWQDYDLNIPTDEEKFLSNTFKILNKYIDYLTFENKKNYMHSKVEAIEALCKRATQPVIDKYEIALPTNFMYTLACMITNQSQFQSILTKWESDNSETLAALIHSTNTLLANENVIRDEIVHRITHATDFVINEIESFLISLSIHFQNHQIRNNETLAFIIAHGYSTASSIADVTNQLIGKKIVEAIDMPITTDIKAIAKQIKKSIYYRKSIKNLILLVDMGSLQDLSSYLQDIPNINIGIANNISTGLALEVGFKILQNVKISKIFEESCKNHTIQYQIIQNKSKPKAILFSSENSYTVNEKIVTLFKKSLPKETDIQIVPHEYNRLVDLGKDDSIFDMYDVIMIFGTFNPNIENVDFLPLGDIISSNEIDFITSALYPYLDEKDMKEFKSRLLLNFSLQNIVGYLTILDAQTVIHYVNDAVQSIQDLLKININFSSSIGLFIHLSCMIERLITNTGTNAIVDLSEYNIHDQRNFNIIENILQPISKHYGIVIPNSEIVYIYEYLKNSNA